MQVCPAFPYESAVWKPKFKGASYGYGFNIYLGGRNVLTLAQPSTIILFGDCAQVNTFQPPASPSHPMLEEFYLIDSQYATIHFRHGSRAQFLFVDGHVDGLGLCRGTADLRVPGETVGRITPAGSMQGLQ